ncbi:MAG TPA: LLM class flavin-dependent oxidoreductase [Dehalococcoidia bacterium]|nr:LLM class flavin-dependent oxidoreductase [Dehalococcoidia bacterium]
MSKLDFGVWDAISAFEMSQASTAEVYARHIRLAQEMERLGYHSYWVIEHQNSPVGKVTSPCVFLTAIAANTTRLRFGAMIWQLPFHNPMQLAQEVAMMDHLSHGRVEFGSGIGVLEHEFIRWGMNFYERAAVSGEAMDIILRAWTQDEVTYEGKYWKFDEALPEPKPFQKPYPPIWIGAHGKPAIEYAAKNNWNLAQNIDTDERVAGNIEYFHSLRKQCGLDGTPPGIFLQRQVHVAETDEKARGEAEQHLTAARTVQRGEGGPLDKTRVGRGSDASGFGKERDREVNVELMRVFHESTQSYDFSIENGLALIGSPKTIIEKLKEGQERVGYTLFTGNHAFGQMPFELVDKSIRLFGEEVIPAFR